MIVNNKPIIVIFEGVDKSGKTTLLNEFNKLTEFRYIAIDRFTISSVVYSDIFCRGKNDYYKNVEKIFSENYNVLVVLVKCDESVITKRLQEHNEHLPKKLSNILYVSKKFEDEFSKSYFCNKLVIDTTHESINECVYRIIKKIKEMEK